MCISFICHLFLSKTGVGEKGREVTQQASPLVGPFLSSRPGLSRWLWSVERVRASRLEGAGRKQGLGWPPVLPTGSAFPSPPPPSSCGTSLPRPAFPSLLSSLVLHNIPVRISSCFAWERNCDSLREKPCSNIRVARWPV